MQNLKQCNLIESRSPKLTGGALCCTNDILKTIAISTPAAVINKVPIACSTAGVICALLRKQIPLGQLAKYAIVPLLVKILIARPCKSLVPLCSRVAW